ncbi:hypothetical protein [Labilibaculum sp.]|uniref:hypothetical protein n=1 Tax=Labilibaculum sp. TaxID=2060723 RepID=UPI002AA5FD60|nr:hypothetical protein [Labilibaculum sp.]MBN2597448.1 hypothetical protein [Marinifilaceae bacterium]
MKGSRLVIGMLLFFTACNSYNHEQYIAKFKANVDAEIDNYTIGEFDSLMIANRSKETLERLKAEKIAVDRFYADNYSWYQLGKNLILTPQKAKEESIKYGFERPYYFLEFLKCDSVVSPSKDEVIKGVKDRLFAKYNQDSVLVFRSSAKELFAAVHKCERSKYFFFINVDFEKVNHLSDKQKKVVAQMTQCGLNRLKEKVEVKDQTYYLTISSGEEIGISESIFTIGKNIYLKLNEQLAKTNPEFVTNTNLSTKKSRYNIRTWEDAWRLYQLYGK